MDVDAGTSSTQKALNKCEQQLFYNIMEMFPEACPTYLHDICRGNTLSDSDQERITSSILQDENYPKRRKSETTKKELNFEEQLELMKQLLPDADPDYLETKCLAFDKPDDFKLFISDALEHRNYPSMKEYLRKANLNNLKQKILTQQKQYTTEFNVKSFLEVIPDPAAHFEELARKPLSKTEEAEHYAICYLRNRYLLVSLLTIKEIYFEYKSILLACNKLNSGQYNRKTKRQIFAMPSTVTQDMPLLQEIAYSEHYNEITAVIAEQRLQKIEERRLCNEKGLMETCGCCCDDEIVPPEIYCCELGCKFCKNCIKRSSEVTFGEGKLDFKCLSDCNSFFSLQTLQYVLAPKLFSQIASEKQLEEVKSASIENLCVCPYCNFAAIPAQEDKLFRCFNPVCMKETCRLCKEPSHIPIRCEEVEKDADVQVRTYIENKMTEALLRQCWKCGIKFIKSDGCNKMTCSCGAKMCYLCKLPVEDYTHFNGPGGDRFHLCPLFSDTLELHKTAVKKGGELAKQEIISKNQKGNLKVDPTSDVEIHYRDLKKK